MCPILPTLAKDFGPLRKHQARKASVGGWGWGGEKWNMVWEGQIMGGLAWRGKVRLTRPTKA